jgi:tRNA (guanine-N(7)-)-methyltransferase subunit TRM82
MKQLLDTAQDNYVIVALNDRVFVGCLGLSSVEDPCRQQLQSPVDENLSRCSSSSDRENAALVFELDVRCDELADSIAANDGSSSHRANPTLFASNPRQVQSVAIDKVGDLLLCGVACYNKNLFVYEIDLQRTIRATAAASTSVPGSESDVIRVPPTAVHRTSKRAGCLCFARVPATGAGASGGEQEEGTGLTVLIAGDLSGDAVAFPLTVSKLNRDSCLPTSFAGHNSEDDDDDDGVNTGDADGSSGSRKLLLGHTASMLTGVRVVETTDNNGTGKRTCRILTSDRDEKVRVSAFPDTHRVYGYLLGHEAFVSCLDVPEGGSSSSTQCVTCSGDGTVRLWDYDSCEELCCLALPDAASPPGLVPARVAIHSSGTRIVVMYDESPRLDLIQVAVDDSGLRLLEVVQTLQCPALTLSVSWLSQSGDDPESNSLLVVLISQSPYVVAFQWDPSSSHLVAPCSDPSLVSVLNRAVSGGADALPTSMPTSILEKDQFGELMMKKNREKRGPASEMPWNNAERKVLAKERERKYKKQKRGSKNKRRSARSTK